MTLTHTTISACLLWRSLTDSISAPRFRRTTLLEVWRFAAGLTAISITAILLTQVDKILLSKLLTLKMFGYYSLAAIMTGKLGIIIGPIFAAVYPRFVQLALAGDEKTLVNFYHRSCQFMSVLTLPIAAVTAAFAPHIILLWTRDPVIVENTHLLVSLLVVGTALNGLMRIPYTLQLAHGWINLTLYQNIVAVLLLTPLTFWATLHHGAVGAASVWITLNSGYVLIGIHLMHRRLITREKWHWYTQDVGLPLFATLIVTLVMRWISPPPENLLVTAVWIVVTLLLSIVASALSLPYTQTWIKQAIAQRHAAHL